MIGQDYFDLRSRLGSALFALRGLVADSEADTEHAAILEKLAGGLKDPFVFIVVGEVNVGKSTLLNALFGADLTQTGVMPTTGRILYFKYGKTLRRLAVTRTLEEVHVPADFLKDFHIVDTPGTNSIEGEHQEITERFVPMADLVIFVFSAMNPWGASAWRFLEKVHTHWMRNVVFVLQQCDLREPEEIQSILAYMQRLCVQRFGREFPTFPVAAKKAYLARSSGIDRDRLLAQSGFTHLEQHISGAIGGSDARLAKLAGALRSAREIMSGLLARSVARSVQLGETAEILHSMEAGLAVQAQRTSAELSRIIEADAADLQHAAQGTMAVVAAQLASRKTMRSVLREHRSFEGLEMTLLARLGDLGRQRWERAMVAIQEDVSAIARQLATRLAGELNAPVPEELRPGDGSWRVQHEALLARIGSIRERVIVAQELEKRLAPALVLSRRLARGQLFCAGACAVAAAAFAAAGLWVAAASAAAGAAFVFLVMGAGNARRLSRARLECESRLASAQLDLKNQLAAVLGEETQKPYENLSRFLQPARDQVAGQEERRNTLQQQAASLARTFDGIEAELRAGTMTTG